MRLNWLFLPNLDLSGGNEYITFSELRLGHTGFFHIPGSIALQELFGCISKLAGTLLFCASVGSRSRLSGNLSNKPNGPKNSEPHVQLNQVPPQASKPLRLQLYSVSKAEFAAPLFLGRILGNTLKNLRKEVEQLQSFPFLALATAFVPPFDNVSPKVMAVPLENYTEQINENLDESPCLHYGRDSLSFQEINMPNDTVEPRTGIKFPIILDTGPFGDNNPRSTSEVLVGTGSKSMRVIKVKTLKIYAFGLYIKPDSVCEKLGPKYASIPTSELTNRPDFFKDLLREDIDMTVRLVVNYNGLKINTVRDAFEKSLRARLKEVNPDTDYHCLRAFGSYFTQDIPLPAGTTIDFQRTSDGQLITKIGGKHIGAVQSKDLCRAFFDMYVGDVPVSVQAKEEIARNVGGIMKRC